MLGLYGQPMSRPALEGQKKEVGGLLGGCVVSHSQRLKMNTSPRLMNIGSRESAHLTSAEKASSWSALRIRQID